MIRTEGFAKDRAMYLKEHLSRRAVALGLPPDSPASVIQAAESERYRQALAARHQLSPDASWQDIADAINAEVKAEMPENFPNG